MAGIYIHIPFCRSRCHYCDFYKTLDTGLAENFIESLLLETETQKNYLDNESVETIYFGGGTPSVLGHKQIRKIMKKIYDSFDISKEAEITFEINPDDAGSFYLNGLAREGINRLSIGVQSWDDNILKFLNRRHTSEQAARSISDARKSGFNNISIDLIYGIPDLSEKVWQSTLENTLKKDVEHISAYHLTIEQNTRFGNMKEQGRLQEVNEDISEKQFKKLVNILVNKGYLHYEISNFSKEGLFSKHNANYWKQVKYLGLGPSAHSYNGYSRQWNIADTEKYQTSINSGIIPFDSEEINEKTKYNEYIMTSLRTMWGIDLEYIEEIFNKEIHDFIVNNATRFINYGMLEKKDKKYLVLTNQGMMISDNIIRELIMP